jgi:hypothetical protein
MFRFGFLKQSENNLNSDQLVLRFGIMYFRWYFDYDFLEISLISDRYLYTLN